MAKKIIKREMLLKRNLFILLLIFILFRLNCLLFLVYHFDTNIFNSLLTST